MQIADIPSQFSDLFYLLWKEEIQKESFHVQAHSTKGNSNQDRAGAKPGPWNFIGVSHVEGGGPNNNSTCTLAESCIVEQLKLNYNPYGLLKLQIVT